MPGPIVEGDKVILKSGSQVVRVPVKDSDYWQGQGYIPATEADIQQASDDARSASQQASDMADAAITGLASGAVDAAVALPALAARSTALNYRAQSALAEALGADGYAKHVAGLAGDIESVSNEALSGRRTVEGVAGLLATTQGREFGEGEAAARRLMQDASRRAPVTSFVASAAPQVAASLALGGSGMAYGALEGAALGGQQAVDQAYLSNAELRGEQWVSSVAIGAVLGAALPLAGLAGKRAGKAVAGRVADWTEAARTALGHEPAAGLGAALQQADSAVNKAYAKTASAISGGDEALLRDIGIANRSDEAIAKRALLAAPEETIEKSKTQIYESLKTAHALDQEVFDEVSKYSLKKANVSKMLAEPVEGELLATVPAKTLGSAVSIARQTVEALGGLDAEMGGKLFAGVIKGAKQQLRTIEKAARSGKSDAVAEAFMGLDQMKRLIDTYSVKAKGLNYSASTIDAAYRAKSLLDETQAIANGVRGTLEDPTLWNGAALAQKRVNAKWHEYLKTTDMFEKNMLTVVQRADYQTGRAVRAIDPAKVSQHVDNLGKFEHSLIEEYNAKYVQAQRELVSEIHEAYGLDHLTSTVKRITDAADTVQRELSKASENAKLVNEFRKLTKTDSKIPRGTGTVVGAVVGGLPGAMVGSVADVGLGLLSDPAKAALRVAGLEAMGKRMSGTLGARLRSQLGGPRTQAGWSVPRLPAASGPVGRAATRGLVPFGSERGERRSRYEHATAEVARLASRPEVLAERVDRAMAPLADAPAAHASATATATRAVQFLQEKSQALIPNTGLTPHLNKVVASDSDISRFGAYLQSVQDPMSVFDELERGTLQPEHVEALRSVYPQIYADLQTQAIEALADRTEPVPYRTAVGLDLLLGLQGAGHESLTSDFLRVVGGLKATQQANRQSSRAPDVADEYSARPERVRT